MHRTNLTKIARARQLRDRVKVFPDYAACQRAVEGLAISATTFYVREFERLNHLKPTV